MAVARPQVAGGTTGLKAALIVFVAVAVVSLTFMIILYTYQSDLVAEAAEAKDRASSDRTKANDARASLEAFAKDVIGDPTHDTARIAQAIAEETERVLSDPRLADTDIPDPEKLAVVSLLGALYDLFSTNARELEKTKADYDDLTNKFEAALAAAKARDEEFTSEINQLKQQYADLARESAAFSDKTRQEIESLQADWEEERKHIGDERDEERRRREEVEKALNQERGRNEKLLAQLAAFRPSEGARSRTRSSAARTLSTRACCALP